MPAFEYTALDGTGRTRKGVEEGDSPRQVRSRLREQGLTPMSVSQVAERQALLRMPVFQQRIKPLELALATRQMATLARAGLPIEEVLATVARQSESPRVRSALTAVRTRVMEGLPLAHALGEFPSVFPVIYRTTIAAGEQAGRLDLVLERLADNVEAQNAMRQKIQLAMFYPAILTCVALLVTVALLTYVVPEVVKVFDGMNQELPLLTRSLIAVSDTLRDWGILMLLVLAGLIYGARTLLKKPAYQRRWHDFLLRLPLIGRLTRGLNTARFARTLNILAGSGVPLLDALNMSASVISNLPMREAVSAAAQRVREGAGVGLALERSGYFPAMTLSLIKSGESSGTLDSMLERAAETQERELEARIAMVMGVFEPLLILTMGAVVLVIVLAILLPIFELNQLVN
ncbi:MULTISPECIES: type II secretion system inner membrane protein GspF [Pseudomonas]|jgi:general secretion pathway protein F|uniref:General secretion pathway protein F n=1 Tax=Pseudomonas abyssi TaxID=170540 RepID=A0A2A3MK13_9PSED|nr:type II secretion system inner membrane protein GspF [Pseudomonas abyssi]MAC98570.1 type II secretion system protein GspF [Pseudomonadales bacterium]MAG65184.1 type II secretion system protein GspF [Pseudomonadales bacterium]PBK05005.1 type II secretion system protein GspF [Pseudomonas abyssi]|tara:strand:- start:7517 stop:8728 length:1212 start_codon:yes stop_codon:yes gene_type:complete